MEVEKHLYLKITERDDGYTMCGGSPGTIQYEEDGTVVVHDMGEGASTLLPRGVQFVVQW